MQKRTLFLMCLVIGIIAILPFVLAADIGAYSIKADILDPIYKFFSTFIKALFIADFNEPALYSRLLLFLVVFLIVQSIVSKTIMAGAPRISPLLSAVVAIIGIRILPAEFINLVMLPYGTLAVVVTSFVPLVILWYFTYTLPVRWMRTIAWTLAAISFIVLAFLRYPVIDGAIWIYVGAAIISLFTPTIQNIIRARAIVVAHEKMEEVDLRAALAKVNQNISTLIEEEAKIRSVNPAEAARMREDIDKLKKQSAEIVKWLEKRH